MAVSKAWRLPTNAEFVGALAVTTLVLVFTSVVMTQKPAWMVGPEESLIRTGAVQPARNAATSHQAMSARWQSLASVDAPAIAPSGDEIGKYAVEQAAMHPGGLQHLDDYYIRVGDKATQQPAIQDNGVDAKVPTAAIASSVYPLLGGFSASSDKQSSAEAFQHELKSDGLNDEAVGTSSGGIGRNEPPLSRGFRDLVGSEGFQTTPLDPGETASWAMYIAVFIVLIGLVVLLAYYLLPQGAFAKSFWEDWSTEHGTQTYYPAGGTDTSKEQPGWSASVDDTKKPEPAASRQQPMTQMC